MGSILSVSSWSASLVSTPRSTLTLALNTADGYFEIFDFRPPNFDSIWRETYAE